MRRHASRDAPLRPDSPSLHARLPLLTLHAQSFFPAGPCGAVKFHDVPTSRSWSKLTKNSFVIGPAVINTHTGADQVLDRPPPPAGWLVVAHMCCLVLANAGVI